VKPGRVWIALPVCAAGVLLFTASARADAPVFDPNPPPDVTAEAESPAGAIVDYALPNVVDTEPDPTVACVPPPHTGFPFGPTLVTCTATDSVTFEISTATFNLTVQDTTPPVLTGVPDPISAGEATGPLTPVTYTPPTATDIVDGNVPVDCIHPSGSGFPVGTTSVSCSATDAHSNTAAASFAVTVVDTTAPSLNLPSPSPVEATSAAGAAVNFSVTAGDLVDPSPIVSCDHPSGAVFPLGRTTVTCTATDAHQNRSTGSFGVTVKDTIAPPNVEALAAKPGNRLVKLSWAKPTSWDIDHFAVYRSRPKEQSLGTEVYQGTDTEVTLRGLRNRVGYRFVVVSIDRADNSSGGVAILATPAISMLYAPANGATVRHPPVLRWRRAARATYYNVQLYRGSNKVFAIRTAGDAAKIMSAWPSRTRLALKARWRYRGRTYRLKNGGYSWFVWPGYGSRSAGRYGPLLGQSTFVVSR
jgi:hypothetical protein